MGNYTKLRRKDSKRGDDDDKYINGFQTKDSNSYEVEAITVIEPAKMEENGEDRVRAKGPKALKQAKKKFVDPSQPQVMDWVIPVKKRKVSESETNWWEEDHLESRKNWEKVELWKNYGRKGFKEKNKSRDCGGRVLHLAEMKRDPLFMKNRLDGGLVIGGKNDESRDGSYYQ